MYWLSAVFSKFDPSGFWCKVFKPECFENAPATKKLLIERLREKFQWVIFEECGFDYAMYTMYFVSRLLLGLVWIQALRSNVIQSQCFQFQCLSCRKEETMCRNSKPDIQGKLLKFQKRKSFFTWRYKFRKIVRHSFFRFLEVLKALHCFLEIERWTPTAVQKRICQRTVKHIEKKLLSYKTYFFSESGL